MKVDFETIAAVLSFVSNSVGIGSLKYILDKDEIKKTKGELEGQIKSRLSDPYYVKSKYQNLINKLKNPFIYILHSFNIAILICLIIILVNGPQSIFGTDPSSPLTEQLNPTEKILYFIWLVGGLISYSIMGILPTYNLFILKSKAKNWLRDNDKEAKKQK